MQGAILARVEHEDALYRRGPERAYGGKQTGGTGYGYGIGLV